jgi:mannitol/fructose-specific phosphotransferase system IIA component (Ntr-type)
MTVMATEKESIPFSAFFSPAEVICQIQGKDRDKALLDMLRLLAQQHEIGNIEEAHAAVLERENDLPTVVAPGLAMPHARLDTIDEIALAVATSRTGIVYDPAKPDNRVKLIVLTLTPKGAPGAYLQALGCLARSCQDPSTAQVVAGLATPDEVWAFFDQGGLAHPDRPHARNVMDPARAKKFLQQ